MMASTSPETDEDGYFHQEGIVSFNVLEPNQTTFTDGFEYPPGRYYVYVAGHDHSCWLLHKCAAIEFSNIVSVVLPPPPVDLIKPSSSASSPAIASSSFITVNYSATDSSGSGLSEVELWARTPSASIYELVATDTTLETPSFDYTATAGDGIYSFYTRARDLAGNYEDAPQSPPDTTTVLRTGPIQQPPGSQSPMPSAVPAGVIPAATPAGATGARVLLSSKALRMKKRGLVAIRLACKGSVPCKGTLMLWTAKPAHTSKRTLKLGSVGFSVAAGAITKVEVQLSSKGRRLVRKLRVLKVRVTLLLSGGHQSSYIAKLRA